MYFFQKSIRNFKRFLKSHLLNIFKDLKLIIYLAQTADQLHKLNDLFNSTQQSIDNQISQIYNEASNSLSELVNEANQIAENPSGRNVNEISDRLENELLKIQSLLSSSKGQENLQKLVNMARESQQQLKDTDNNLKSFMAQRDVVNELIDDVNDKLAFVEQKNQREAVEAQKDLETLNVSLLTL
jgi:vacuolar-type H+-ATPase subunit E/Vma4